MTEKIVVASLVCKHFEIEDEVVRALNSINLRINPGEFICLYGPSGAGKTTLLNIIGGLDKPTSGKILVFDHDLGTYDEDFLATFRATHIGFVFQSYNLISTLTAKENIAFAMELAGWKNNRINERSDLLLKMIGLERRKNHFPAQLSGGERQRIAFARALANEPPLLLADEPTGNLDPETGLEIFRILEQIKTDGKTVIVATHDQRLLKLASRSFHIKEGRLIQYE
ncbi:MAG: ABC transporter ATP-binding protein [Candidatus Bathyarchaeota archaeon]|nr:ABC transporter ATP-binding protein [Candidatus Bathyarchaeum tardum]WGM88563.1 MAG: ABC transporter ATP-binding protein [Candidatus Bathyarchaeum tardum]WNZ29170.1 MAG: ABC transporter ATP-binding protein [Candidatus Bathyarchaeota archaeon]